MNRRSVVKVALAASAAAVVAACTGDDGGTDGGGGQPVESAPVAKLTAEPAADAKDVPVRQPVTVTVANGSLTDVQLTNADGKVVAGSFNADRTAWTSGEVLGYGRTYRYAATATGADGKSAQLSGSFTTIDPAEQIRVTVNPTDNAQVGVAMPVSVKFTGDVTNKAKVERALKIETSKDVEGSWGWLSDRQVDFRPREYWPAGTEVSVAAEPFGAVLTPLW